MENVRGGRKIVRRDAGDAEARGKHTSDARHAGAHLRTRVVFVSF